MMKAAQPTVVCLGFFDGVHKGHLALVRAARRIGDEMGWPVCVHTFDHAPGNKGTELTTLEEKERLLRKAGADQVAVSAFDDQLRMMHGDDFFRQIVLGKLQAGHVVCGDDHRFGHKGAWGVKELADLCKAARIGLTVVPEVTLEGGMRISSTAVRRALEAGDYALAEAMLGRSLAGNEDESSCRCIK